MDSIQEK